MKRNRIFLFGVFEGYRESQFSRIEATVPTPTIRAQVLQAAPAFADELAVVPLPNQPYASTATNALYVGTGSARRADNHEDFKADIRRTKSSSLALTYGHGRPTHLLPSAYTDTDQTKRIFGDRATASYVTGGASWTSETRFGYNLNSSFPGRTPVLDAAHRAEQSFYGRRLARPS